VAVRYPPQKSINHKIPVQNVGRSFAIVICIFMLTETIFQSQGTHGLTVSNVIKLSIYEI
jgi:hypothetical protein